MPIIKARSSSIIDSVDLRGTPTVSTASSGTNTTQIASTAFVSGAVSDLVASAPAVLDTLSELATALGNDADFATTVANSIATKVSLAGDTMTGSLILAGDPSSNLEAATKQYVDGLINSQMIYSTDDVAEGVTNLYYTNARVFSAVSLTSDNTSVLDYDSATGIFTYNHPTSDGILEGATNKYYTDARVRNAVSLTTADNTILSYSSSTGEFVYTTPNTDQVSEGSTNLYFTTARARDTISVSGAGSYNSATGVIQIDGGVTSVNGQTGVVVLDTDNIDEGSSNLYFTDARAAAAVSLTTDDSNILAYNTATGTFTFVTPSTDSIDEGGVNLYYTDARVRAAVSASGDISYNSSTGNFSYSTPTTDGVNEGSSNLYFTNARARQAISLTTDNASVLDYDSATGEFTFSLGSQTTDDVAEGSTNLYYTNARAFASNSIASGSWNLLSYDNSTGEISLTTPSTADVAEDPSATVSSGTMYFTNARARNAVSVTDAGGDGSLSYDSATGVITYTGPSATEVRAHFSAGTGIAYDNSTGVISTSAIPNESLQNSSVVINGLTINLGGSTALDTDDVSEGSNNLYYTAARWDAKMAAADTGDLAEGTNLYYTDTRVHDALSAGTGVTYDGAGEFSIGQPVGTTDNVTFGDVTVSGDLTVNGTLTTINSTDLNVADKNITIADGAANAAAADGAGITVDGANATITYASGTDTWNFNKTVVATFEGNITGNVTGNLTGDVTGTVSDISNHDTDALAEGSTNLYYTDTRVRNAISLTTSDANILSYDSATGEFTFDFAAGNTDGVAEGSTNLYFTTQRARDSISATTATGVTYDSATGVIALASIPNSSLVNTDVTINGTTVTLGGSASFDTDSVVEGASNLYFTQGRARDSLSVTTSDATIFTYDALTGEFTFDLAGFDTSEIAEDPNATTSTGTMYFTDARARDAISMSSNWANVAYDSATGVITVNAPDTDDVSEGATNQYFTNARARQAVSLTTDNTDAMSYNSTTGVFTFTLNSVDTDEIAEGATNLYFTTARARNSISAGANISYDSTTGIISSTSAVDSVNGQTGVVVLDTDNIDEGSSNLYFTDARARSALTVSTDNSSIFDYDSGTGLLTYVTPNTDAIAEGSTNLYYTDARADARIAAASVGDVSDVDLTGLADGYALIWSAVDQTFVPQNIAQSNTTTTFTGDGTTTSFNTGVEVSSIENTQVFINGLFQAPTYSYTLSTSNGETSIVFDTAPDVNDYVMIRVVSTSQLTAGGVLNENSNVDGGTF